MAFRGWVGFIAGALLWRFYLFPFFTERMGVAYFEECSGPEYLGWLLAVGFFVGFFTILNGRDKKS